MIDFLAKGGILVVPILFCSIIAAAIVVERAIRFRQIGAGESEVAANIIRLVAEGREDQAVEAARRSAAPVAGVLAGALEVRGRDRRTAERVIGHAIEAAVRNLSRYLGTLAAIGSIAPMLGLLGTVTGMIKAFMVIQQMGGKVNAAVLAGGIWEAMLTTALGLAVALPAMVAHSWLDSRVERFEAGIRSAVIALAKIMDR